MYETEYLSEDDDDGTMPENVKTLGNAVIGHKIVSAEKVTVADGGWSSVDALVITLDNGKRVELIDSSDCCAFTELNSFLLHPERVDHVILGVGTTDRYDTWHIYADLGDVLELSVGWSAGNPFYYGYGFSIQVKEVS